jgi:hypothetical protein
VVGTIVPGMINKKSFEKIVKILVILFMTSGGIFFIVSFTGGAWEYTLRHIKRKVKKMIDLMIIMHFPGHLHIRSL